MAGSRDDSFVTGLMATAHSAGVRALSSGQGMAEWLIDNVPRIPVRDLATLRRHHDGLDGAELAGALITTASRLSAAVGAASGALMSAEELAPPAWLALPLELAVETLGVAAIELKLLAELQEVYGQPVEGTLADRSIALVRAWAERRGVTPAAVARSGGVGEVFGRGARNEVIRLVRRRLLGRLGRNLSSLAPLLAGAAAGAEVNRRATRSLGEAVVRDLAARN